MSGESTMLANIATQLAALTPVTATPGRKFIQARGALEQESLTSGFDRKFQVLIEQIREQIQNLE